MNACIWILVSKNGNESDRDVNVHVNLSGHVSGLSYCGHIHSCRLVRWVGQVMISSSLHVVHSEQGHGGGGGGASFLHTLNRY